jgi:hypothetical protein
MKDVIQRAVYVIYTTVEETLAALRVADPLAKAMHVPLTLVHFRTVPYATAVGTPNGVSPVETDAFADELRAEGFDMRVRVLLCRNPRQGIPYAFKPRSLVVVAGRRSWWPFGGHRWRQRLEAAGHYVVFVDVGSHKESFKEQLSA